MLKLGYNKYKRGEKYMKLFRTSFPEQKIELKGNKKILQKIGLGVLGAVFVTSTFLMNGTITIPNRFLNTVGIESQYHESKVFAFDTNKEDKITKEVTQDLHFLCLTKEGDFCNEYEEIEKDGKAHTYTLIRYDGMENTVIPINEFLKENGYENNTEMWYSETKLSSLKSQIENDRQIRNAQLKKEEEERKRQPINSVKEHIWPRRTSDPSKFRLDEIYVLDMYNIEQPEASSLHFLYPVRKIQYNENNVAKTADVYREIVEGEYAPIYIQTSDGKVFFDYEGGNAKSVDGRVRQLNTDYEAFISDKLHFKSQEEFETYLEGYSKHELLGMKSQMELQLYGRKQENPAQTEISNESEKQGIRTR